MAKIIHLRGKCIGCAVCYEMQPTFWCMSKKDGKALLINSISKGYTSVLTVSEADAARTEIVARACPVNIIKLS